MSLFIASLNSGSNGNCYYVGNHHEAILVDAGISCREIVRRMARLGLNMQKVRAVFISHEHTDHIRGLPVLAKKFQLPVYITGPTLASGRLIIDNHLVRPFTHQQAIGIGNITVTAFSKHHNAADPYSFMVSGGNINVGVFTDLGIACPNLVHYFKQCHAAFLESNYDEVMLENGGYPYHLKHRIKGGKGHLSNRQALELFKLHRPPFMSHLLLSHLSKNNNCPQLVQDLFCTHAGGVQLIVAGRDGETAVYEIAGAAQTMRPVFGRQITMAFG